MEVVQQIFREIDRDPTDVELEVIAQTWSEHCKHRICLLYTSRCV